MDRAIEYKMKFADKLNSLLRENNMTQDNLSAELELSVQTISKWVNKKSEPKLSHLIKLTEIFGVSFDYLLGMSDNKNSSDDNAVKQLEELKEYLTSVFPQQEISNTSETGKLNSMYGLCPQNHKELLKLLGLDYN